MLPGNLPPFVSVENIFANIEFWSDNRVPWVVIKIVPPTFNFTTEFGLTPVLSILTDFSPRKNKFTAILKISDSIRILHAFKFYLFCFEFNFEILGAKLLYCADCVQHSGTETISCCWRKICVSNVNCKQTFWWINQNSEVSFNENERSPTIKSE